MYFYRIMSHIRTQFLSLLCLAGITAGAQEAEPAKSRSYNLFNPAPKSEMRVFAIDRPDVTESPITVDAGHFQFEGDLFKFSKPRQGNSERAYNIVNGLYKMGLSHSWDVHIGLELYNVYRDAEGKTVERGYGNTTIRLKYNFWGNDGTTRTALGAIPYVILPTSPVDEEVSFGIGFPLSCDVSDSQSAGAQFQFDFIPDGNGGYDMSYLQTVVWGGTLVGNLDFYVEGMGIFSKASPIFTANGGLIYNLTENVKIDVATNLGLVHDAPTRAYVGLSFRI
jgi:opacity protein-like surface antigen